MSIARILGPLFRIACFSLVVFAYLAISADVAAAHLVIQLRSAEKDAIDDIDATDVVAQFAPLVEPDRFAEVIQNLPKHLRRFPGSLVIKAGSNWSTATIVFPDGRQTRLVHLGLTPASVPSPEALEMTSAVSSAPGGISANVAAAMLLTPPESGDPYESILGRRFEDDDNWQTPTLVELRMPLNGQALFDVLNARARLELPDGAGAGPECNMDKGRGCTPKQIIAPLIAAAYGLESVETQFESASPLTYTLDLALLYGEESIRSGSPAGCLPVYPKLVEGRGEDVLLRAHFASWALWTLAISELKDDDRLTDASVIDLMRKKPDLIEMALAGVYDPAGLWMVDCTMRREVVQGENHGLPNVVLRSRYYDRASDLIGSMTADRIEGRDDNEVLFFDAASHVTRGLAVGLIDVLEIYNVSGSIVEFFSNETLSNLITRSGITPPQSWLAHIGVLTAEALRFAGAYYIADKERPPQFGDLGVPDDAARQFLRELNLILYLNNRQMLREVYRALRDHDGQNSNLGLPDPINSPVGRRLSEGFWFDLRMVLFEQGLIENELPARRLDPAYHEMIDELDGIARVGTAMIAAGQPHRAAWIDRVVYNVVSRVSHSNRFDIYTHFLEPRPGIAERQRMLAQSFDNYWFRVTIGSTYVLLLHAMEDPTRLTLLCRDPGVTGSDRRACEEAVSTVAQAEEIRRSVQPLDFSHTVELPPHVEPLGILVELYMQKRMAQAPRARQSDVATELRELDTLRVSDFAASQDALAKTLGSLLAPSGTRMVYRCESLVDGIRAVPLEVPDSEKAFRALTDVAGAHWRTLPDLFDILVGGATTAPPLLNDGGEADEEICKGIEARFLAVQALAAGEVRPSGEGSSGVLVPNKDGQDTFVAFDDVEATQFRSNSRRFWLHLAYHLCAVPKNCVPAESAVQIARQTIALADETARWRAKLRLLAQVEDQGGPSKLGFNEDEKPSELLVDLDGAAMSPDADINVTGQGVVSDDMRVLIDRMAMPNRWQRLVESRSDIETYFSNRSDRGAVPLPYPVKPLVDRSVNISEQINARPLVPQFLLDTTSAGTAINDRGETVSALRGDLVFRMPLPRDQLGAAANKLEQEPVSVPYSEALPPVLDIPFGLTIEGLAKSETGQLYLLNSDGRNTLLAQPRQTKSALASTGVPELFEAGVHRISVRPESDEPFSRFTIVLDARPTVFGIDLNPFELVLWEEGKSIEQFPARLLEAYQASVVATFEDGAEGRLEEALSEFSFSLDLGNGTTLDFAPDIDSTCVKLGQSLGCYDADLTLGDGLDLSVHAGFTLSLKDRGGVLASIKPRLHIIWTGKGLSVRSADLGTPSSGSLLNLLNEKLNEALKPLWIEQDAINDATVRLKLGSNSDSILQLEVRGSIDTQLDCPAPWSVVLELGGAAHFEDVFKQSVDEGVEAALKAATTCAAQQTLKLADADFQTSFRIGSEELTAELVAPDVLDNAKVLPIELRYSGLPEQVARGIDFDVSTQTLNLSETRTETDKTALNAIVKAAAIKQVNALLGSRVEIREISIERRKGGGLAVFGDLMLREVPYLGDVVLPRVDLAHPNGTNFKGALEHAMSGQATELLDKALPDVMELPFVGRFARKPNGTIEFSLDKKLLTLSGELTVFDDVSAPTKLIVSLETGAVDVVIDETGALSGALSALGPLQDGLGFGPLKIENVRFDRVPGQPRRYAVFFDVDVQIEGLFSVSAENLMLSESGLRLGPVIGGSIPFPVETGVVSLSSIGIQFFTGEGGGKSGIVLNTDITAFNAAIAKLAKIDARLDLRDIDQLAFSLDGDLIVLDSFPLMYSRGEVALQEASFDFEAGTVPQIEDIVSARGSASLKGKDSPPKFVSRTALSILRVRLSEDELKLVLPVGTTGSIDYKSFTHLLIAKGNLHLSSPLDFSDPRLGGRIALDLFGWSPGGVGIQIDLRKARAEVRALFLDAGITVAHADLFDPQVIIDMLLAIFDIRLEDLLNVKLDNIEIKLGKIGSDGSTGPDGDDGNDGSSQSSQSGSAEGNSNGSPPGQAGKDDGTADEPAPENTNPANEGGDVFATRYCEHVYTDKNGVKRFEFWLNEDPNITGKHIYRGHSHKSERDALSWHNLTFREGTRPIQMCVSRAIGPKRAGPTWTTILTKREFVGPTSNCHHPSRTPEPPVVDAWSERDERAAKAAGIEARLLHAKSPLMCWVANGETVFVWAQILVNSALDVEALIFCPAITTVPQQVRKDKYFEAVCGKEAPMSHAGSASEEDFREEKREKGAVRIITAAAEARIIDGIRSRILTGQEASPSVSYTLPDLPVQVDARPLVANDPTIGLRVTFTHENSGKRRTMFLWDANLSQLIYHEIDRDAAAAILRHWYLRQILNRKPVGDSAPEIVAGPNDPAGQSFHVVSYRKDPGLNDLFWFEPAASSTAPITVSWSPSLSGSISSGSVAWPRLLVLTSQLLQSDPADFPSNLQLAIGRYSAIYERAFLLFGPKDVSSDDRVLLAGLTEDILPSGTAEPVLPDANAAAGLQTATRATLACRITQAHKLSLGQFNDGLEFDPQELVEVVFAPDEARETYGLAHDPVPALFEEMADCP